MPAATHRAVYAAILLAVACGGSPTAAVGEQPTSFSFAGRAPLALSVSSPTRASADTLRAGFDLLVIRRTRIVLRQVSIGTSSGGDCSLPSPTDRCRSLMTDVSIVELPLGGMAEQRFSLKVPAGAYGQVALALVAAPTGDAMAGKSIRVEGTFNGVPFTYETELELSRAMVLPKPLVIGWNGIATNVTVSVPVTSWFRAGDGSLLNPAHANRSAEIRANIARSLSAFEDRDRDGDERSG